MQDQTLDDLLGTPEGQTATPEAPQPVQQDEPPAQLEPTGDKPADTVPPAVVEPEDARAVVPRQAVLDERRKRQELEKKLQELEARLQPQPQQNEPPPPEPDWYAEPEKAAQYLQQQVQQRMYQTAVYQSELIMKKEHADYDEVSSLFAEAAQKDHRLAQAVFQHPFPAQYAYQVGKQIQLMKEIGDDPVSYRTRLEAEILAKHGITPGQAPAQQQRPVDKAPAVPRSLGRDVSQQPRDPKTGKFDAPASLDDLLG